MSTKFTPVIAIDGPSGSGKSTITQYVAKRLGLVHLDTGAMFRAVAYFLNSQNIASEDDFAIEQTLNGLDFNYGKSKTHLVEINGENLTQKIRDHHISTLASQYSQNAVVRDFLKQLQRKIAKQYATILEGRDIGSVIFPQAALKVFLTANDQVRAKRRLAQLKQMNPASNYTIDQVFEDMRARDRQDEMRDIAPLIKAKDAIELDTSALSIDEVVDQICTLYKERSERFL